MADADRNTRGTAADAAAEKSPLHLKMHEGQKNYRKLMLNGGGDRSVVRAPDS